MPPQLPISIPPDLNIAGIRKPPRLPGMWLVQGTVISSIGMGVGGILVRFINKDAPNAEPEGVFTDTAGGFSHWLPASDAGYRAQPVIEQYIFCPGYYDFWGSSPLIRFTAISRGSKDESHGK